MLTLGLHFSTNLLTGINRVGFALHDTAAALLRDEHIVAAIEEERLNRVKHCNTFPVRAIEFCLAQGGIGLADVDAVAVNVSQFDMDVWATTRSLNDSRQPAISGVAAVSEFFERYFGVDVSDRLVFCPHHAAHVWSSFVFSGFDDSLVVILDGDGPGGDGRTLSGLVGTVRDGRFDLLREIPAECSIGNFYTGMIRLVGYDRFDEYKIMGLAPYGDSARFRQQFGQLYRLEADGQYRISPNLMAAIWPALRGLGDFNPPRRKGEPFTQAHRDFAAALQETTETLVMHVMRWAQAASGKRLLNYAGGVAHNCTMNGKLLRSGLFDDIFVQPAAHDAGAAIGAAFHARAKKSGQPVSNAGFDHLSLGTPVPDSTQLQSRLQRWAPAIRFEHMAAIADRAAQLIADGAVIGWVQGRSEFGPRALGNRSILADPRPAQNKDRINRMIKKREGYRPFAPSVLEEYLHEYFDLPESTARLPFMVFAVPVKKQMQDLLGAVTHVDGSARVQSVSAQSNELYWQLISRFHEITGVPMLLNTSFNNNAEPIVDSVDDAVACFLTTELTHLVVGDFLVEKDAALDEVLGQFAITVLESYRVTTGTAFDGLQPRPVWSLESNVGPLFQAQSVEISEPMFRLLTQRERVGIFDACEQAGIDDIAAILREARALWDRRAIHIRPLG